MYSSTISLTSMLDGVGGQRHAPAGLNGCRRVPGIFPWGKGGRTAWLTILPPSCVDGLESW
jgi:hypothetical protein